jgi:hypothetical protein
MANSHLKTDWCRPVKAMCTEAAVFAENVEFVSMMLLKLCGSEKFNFLGCRCEYDLQFSGLPICNLVPLTPRGLKGLQGWPTSRDSG